VSKCCGVYKITCLENGKIYIGSSKNINSRWNNHRWNLRNGKHHNYFLQSDWDMYGEDVFVFENPNQ
jgi:group I intron endonuclease